jgi:hypothetical protein
MLINPEPRRAAPEYRWPPLPTLVQASSSTSEPRPPAKRRRPDSCMSSFINDFRRGPHAPPQKQANGQRNSASAIRRSCRPTATRSTVISLIEKRLSPNHTTTSRPLGNPHCHRPTSAPSRFDTTPNSISPILKPTLPRFFLTFLYFVVYLPLCNTARASVPAQFTLPARTCKRTKI